MGQYYTPLLIAEDGTVATLNSHHFGNGLKLMEHSWIGNDFVNAVISLINGVKKKVAWIGDYSLDPYSDAYSEKLSEDEFVKYYQIAWNEVHSDKELSSGQFSDEALKTISTEKDDKGFLINHTKKVYLNLRKYFDECIVKEGYIKGYCVNPLPLLTACGNGRGGGDYHSKYPGQEFIGTWAFDEIEYSKQAPDYERLDVIFKED